MERTDWEETTQVPDGVLETLRETERMRPYVVVLTGSDMGKLCLIAGEIRVGRSPVADLYLNGGGISRLHCQIRVEGDQYILEDLDSRNGTYIDGQRIRSHRLQNGDRILLGITTVLKFVLCDPVEAAFTVQMSDWAFRDALTGAYSKRYLLDRIDREVFQARQCHTPLSLLVLDLDHFKQINDRHGHLAGDYVLIRFTEQITQRLQKRHLFIRYGGEEFVIMAPGSDRLQAIELADQLRAATEAMALLFDGQPIAVTVSVGLATLPDDRVETPMDLIALADQALYQAKSRGRNCVAFCGDQAMDTTCPE